jgi:hypothetical protein
MSRWFLSYHSPDQALAERLKAAIEGKDSASRVFFAPEHLRAGRSWSKQLADEIAQADAFILLIGEKGIGDWQELEYDEALDKWAKWQKKSPDFPLIVVLLEGQIAPGLQFLRRMHWIITRDPTSEMSLARIFDAAAGRSCNPSELWRHTSPYRGLEAMEEKDSDYFFGRRRETVEVLNALAAPERLPILIGNSGVGKTSLAKAGVLAALKRQAWPEEVGAPNVWPAVFQDSRQWCFLSVKPGTDPLKALVESFLDTWQYNATDPERVKQQHGWIELLLGKATLSDLIDATERRRKELDQPKPPAFFLYVDQGEELYVRAEEHQRRRFSELLAQALPEARLRTMMSMRSDFLGSLQNDEPLFKARQQIDVPPLREAELREVVSRPAQLLAARFESESSAAAPPRIRSRTWALCRSCPTRSTICGRKWCVGTTGRCAFRRNPSSLAACSSTVPTRFWRRIRGPKLPCGAFSLCGVRLSARTASRPGAALPARSSQMRSGGSSASWPTIPIGSSSPRPPRRARLTPRWRTKRFSGAGTSCANGCQPSASSWPGAAASRPRAAPGRRRRTPRSMTPCLWARR